MARRRRSEKRPERSSARSWPRSGGLWGGGWSLCCRGPRAVPTFPTLAGAPREAGIIADLSAAAAGTTADGETVYRLEIARIDHNPHQTRREFDRQALEELARSIEVQGVIQPIMVRPGTAGRFILILGERRVRASKMAAKTHDPGDCEARLGAASSGDDAGGEPATPGPELHRAGGGVLEPEHGIQTDAGGDWKAGGHIAGDRYRITCGCCRCRKA